MPTLNKFDNYDACIDVYKEKARYCIVRTAIKPDSSSNLYNFIIEFSSRKKQHFRHGKRFETLNLRKDVADHFRSVASLSDKLLRGVCLNTCQKLLTQLDELQSGEAAKFYVPPFDLDYNVCEFKLR